MASQLSRRDVEDMKSSIDKTIHKVVGSSDSLIYNTVEKCLLNGYDRRKIVDKLTSVIDSKKASRLADKLQDLLDDLRHSQKSKKRSHDADSRDRDSKKLRKEENDKTDTDKKKENSADKPPEELSPMKIKEMMKTAQREIEERKKSLLELRNKTQPKVPMKLPPPQLVKPTMLGPQVGLLKREDAEKARKIAQLQAQIQSKLASGIIMQGLISQPPPIDKPKPLILDDKGNTIDVTGKAIQLTHVAPTLKANIRAKKREEFKTQLNDKTGDDLSENSFFDSRIGAKPSVRNKRALKFNEPGKFQQIADRIRMKAQLEKLQNEISQIARKTGISSATKLALIAPKSELQTDDIPHIEWWDSVIAKDDLNTMDGDNIAIRQFSITNLVEHPTQMRPPTETNKPVYMPVFLTKKERKKLRRQNRREAWKEEQEKIRLGLEAPPEPKLRISNLMRILGTEAVQDPTKIEAHVRDQMAKRQKAHEQANAARRLTDTQRREKKIKKLKEDTSGGVHVAVYRVRDLHENASKKFKVETNAKQLYMTGCVLLFKDCCVIVVEGGVKQQKKYKRLMMNRIKWEEDLVKDNDGNEVPNTCHLVWEGTTKYRNFGEIKFKVCPMEKMAREFFQKHKVEHYWDLAYSGAVLEQAEEEI
ncbi:U4/U6 small nuclear ribonucleoprotein Prp3 [Ctenocephalides felis]|uniref:U4/U6 small nuclear ribonucleoprotein Prp3 n=1 Tax=Ctenocephalides felis TaxID=7515 RepID=UPI000E6E27E7|nr:U4/U6 small nuclear ribonucleoprotein Prp3 [Ctenocephalides felis]